MHGSMQLQILMKIYCSGHFGTDKTEEIVKRNFYIRCLRRPKRRIYNKFLDCILCNKKRGKVEEFQNTIPKEDVPLTSYHMDIVHTLPSS